jgi:hypothetical protein
MLVRNYSKNYSREQKRQLVKDEYVTNYNYFRHNNISKLLFGKCLVFEGIEQSGWYPRKNDLIVHTESNLSRKEIHRLNVIANSFGKEIFVKFGWGPKGPGSIIISIIIEKLTEEIIKRLFNQIFKNKKDIQIKRINIMYENDKQYLTLIDDIDNSYEFIIKENVKELKQKVINTIDVLRIPYKVDIHKENKYTYDSSGNKIIYEINGEIININV